MPGNPRLRAQWPSRAEVENLLREHGTISGAARALGRPVTTMRHIVKELGVVTVPHANAMPPSATQFGWDGEDHAALVLGAQVMRVHDNRMNEYDLRWQGRRVEVKTAHPSLAGVPPSLGWTFALGRNAGKNDLYFCIACAENGLPRAYFMIPPAAAPPSILRIPLSLRSKWARYEWRPTSATFPS